MISTRVERDALTLEQRVPSETSVREPIPLLTGGMRTDRVPEDLADTEAVHIHNIHLFGGRQRVDTGYMPFGSTYIGQAQDTYQTFYSDGSTRTFLLTTSTLYYYNTAFQAWRLVSQVHNFTTSVNAAAGGTSVTITSIAGFFAPSLVGVTLDDGSEQIVHVTSIVGSDIHFTETLTGPATAGNNVSIALSLHGDTAGLIKPVFVTFPATEEVIWSNGIDPIYTVTGTVVTILAGMVTNPTTCRAMIVAHEQLLLGYTIENGVAFPYRVRASDQASPTTWTGGIAAEYNLQDTTDPIQCFAPLGPYTYVYRLRSIMRGTYQGLLDFVWLWEYMIGGDNNTTSDSAGDGAISQKAVVAVQGKHLIVGSAGVYIYGGGYDLDRTVGDKIYDDFLSPNGDFNPTFRETLFALYVAAYDEVWICYPSDGSNLPNAIWRLDRSFSSWFHREFADKFISASPYQPVFADTWANAIGVWETDNVPWNSFIATKNVPNLLLCGPNDTTVMAYDYASQQDHNSVIPWEIITKQWGDGTTFVRWERLVLLGFGTVTVDYTIDEALFEFLDPSPVTWNSLGTFNLGSTQSFTYVYIDRVTTRMQFRLSGTDPNFQLRRGQVQGVVEAEW